MRAIDIIEKKRDGGRLTTEEISFFVSNYARDVIPDYQAAAWAMAVLLRGMDARETTDLTMTMVESGDQLDLSNVVDIVVDKHSTGGVGDKTTLVVEPVVSACGVPVGKMSGRGLSYTGGTLDKMESIPGFTIDLSMEEFINQLKEVEVVLAGQTADLAPADGKLYALRDVTGTVPSAPLIASSVMSKKIAAGAQGIVLDVKVGLGAFMQDVEAAEELAQLMVDIGQRAGRQVVAVISDMNQPLGNAVGNSLEVVESIDTLQGGGPADLRTHAIELSAHLLVLGGAFDELSQAKAAAVEALANGAALAKFKQLVQAQGGDVAYVEDPGLFPKAEIVESIGAPSDGFVAQVNAREVGLTVVGLGGGREKKGDPIDHAVGVQILTKIGDQVTAGDQLFVLHSNDRDQHEAAKTRLLAAHSIVPDPVDPLPHFYGTFSSDG